MTVSIPLSSFLAALALAVSSRAQDEAPLSEATEGCIFCHENLHPGIVADWRRSRHARSTVAEALERDELERRMSADEVPEALRSFAVGCAECHTHAPDTHPDSAEHGEHRVHTVVTPRDCAVCHPVEVEQFGQNIMAHAHANLVENELFTDLMRQINGVQTRQDGALVARAPHASTNEDACLTCHGTEVQVVRMEKRDTGLGEITIPVLSGWPNQGVGRVNPDGSLGACTACHTRHQFAIEMARKPHTCAQCHKGPDVPAYKVYQVSKHGNLYESLGEQWDYTEVPWRPGEHFTAPTCATCHASLLVDAMDRVVAPRTHRMNDRLFTRLFGLPYAHAHPESPETHTIANAAGLPLPCELTGEPVAEALIDGAEQERRQDSMRRVCAGCHGARWVAGHFTRLEHTIEETNELTLTATELLLTAWKQGAARGIETGDSIFNETLERLWVQQWLFYANSTRFASAMMGADYGVFANGRFFMAKNLREMETLLELHADSGK